MSKVIYNGKEIELVNELEEGYMELDILTDTNINENTIEMKPINLENTIEVNLFNLENTHEIELDEIK